MYVFTILFIHVEFYTKTHLILLDRNESACYSQRLLAFFRGIGHVADSQRRNDRGMIRQNLELTQGTFVT